MHTINTHQARRQRTPWASLAKGAPHGGKASISDGGAAAAAACCPPLPPPPDRAAVDAAAVLASDVFLETTLSMLEVGSIHT